MPSEGPRGVACLLRLPFGVVAESPDVETRRVDLHHDTFANDKDPEPPEREDGAESRASVRHERREAIAPTVMGVHSRKVILLWRS